MTQQDLKAAMIAAMKAKDSVRLGVMRGLIAACTNELVSAKGPGPDGTLTSDDVMNIILKASKQRKDSIEQFEAGGRPELAEAEKAELAILMEMLPAQMSQSEVEAAVKAKAAEMNVTDKTGANQLMGAVMKDLKGKADGTVVKAVVDKLFS